ncbi:MAG: flagellar biosynthesis anti-sigma factor FlgM [Acidobacteriaceae bacterium]|nr:flagellar biosynthesis anti-sigma factor FlgM [Acidobacteriaceae bacterium]
MYRSSDKKSPQKVSDLPSAAGADSSQSSGILARYLDASAEEADARVEKIASLRQAIAEGNYSVSASRVADKILETLVR